MPLSKQGETKAEAEWSPAIRLARRAGGEPMRRPAPVHLWNPADCGAIDIRIDRDGVWHHEGRRIARPGLVRLFASILRREADGGFALVTPVERLSIEGEDAPFLAVDIETADAPRSLAFLTNLGEVVVLDRAHPLRFGGAADEGFVPYISVRPGLEARLTRAVAAELAGLVEERNGVLGVESAGHFFVIGAADGPA